MITAAIQQSCSIRGSVVDSVATPVGVSLLGRMLVYIVCTDIGVRTPEPFSIPAAGFVTYLLFSVMHFTLEKECLHCFTLLSVF